MLMRAVREADGTNGARRPEWRTQVSSFPLESQVQIFAMCGKTSSVWRGVPFTEFAGGKKQGTFLVRQRKQTHKRKKTIVAGELRFSPSPECTAQPN